MTRTGLGAAWRMGIVVLVVVTLQGSLYAAESCEEVVKKLNGKLATKIDEQELVGVLRTLNQTGNASLPEKFVTKKKARTLGWQPGKNLWSNRDLKGRSIGGDRFANREGRLPGGKSWREADLGYQGGRRGAQRILFSSDGLRKVTVDHYNTFTEVPACQ